MPDPSSDSPGFSVQGADSVEDLVARCLEEAELAAQAAIDRVFSDFPNQREAIQRRLKALDEAGIPVPGSSLRAGTVDAPEPPPEPPSLVGEELGDYRIIENLGRGGQATVYLAIDNNQPRKVAVKVLDPAVSLAEDPGALLRFRREAEMMRELEDPGVCSVYEMGAEGPHIFIVMRYVKGQSLASLIPAVARGEAEAQGGLEQWASSPASEAGVREVVSFIAKAARSLSSAHEFGVIHRDIKPGNLMVNLDGDPVLLDFGLARNVSRKEMTLTATGDVFGTPQYMSPEQLRGDRAEVDVRSDVYSLGVTLYETLGLRRPFQEASRGALFEAILHRNPADLRSLNPSVDEDLARVVAKAMEKARASRYANASEFAADLEAWAEGRPLSLDAQKAGEALKLWMRRHPRQFVICFVGFLLTLIAAVAVGYALGKG